MTRVLVLALLIAMTMLGSEEGDSVPAGAVTFNKDILPILQANCQGCHRPGGVAPMSLLTYDDARPWAKAIKAAVITRKMPPWFADPQHGEFRNAPKLTPANVNTIVAWADRGAYEGNLSDKPAPTPPSFHKEGWRIEPDVVVSMPKPHSVDAKGVGEIKEFMIPSPFKVDTWVSAIEIRPGDPSVVHHVILQVPQQQMIFGGGISAQIVKGLPVPGTGGYGGGEGPTPQQTGIGKFMTMEAVYAPGSLPLNFSYAKAAKLIPGGKPIRLEVHYTPNGKATTDKTSVAFTLAKAPAERRFVIMAPESMVDPRKPIPAGEPNWDTTGELAFTRDVELVWFMPHMHLRGKDMTYRLIYPNGREETVLSARFNFHWQLSYESEDPMRVPKGTRMIVTAHHDNSANNPDNPTPGQPVKWGEMTGDEMMLPWFGVIADRDATPETIAVYRPGGFTGVVPRAVPGFPVVPVMPGVPGTDKILQKAMTQ